MSSATRPAREPATRRLAQFASGFRYEHMPKRIADVTEQHTANVIGCALAGRTLESARIVFGVHKRMSGAEEATVFGEGIKLPAAIAAGLNGLASYCTMNDDTFFEGTVHPGHTAVPAALAVCEAEGKSGRDYLAAVVAGFEVGCRVAASLCQSQESHKARIGWHCNISDAIVGVVAAGHALGLNEEQFVAGLGIAASSSSGIAEVMNPPPSHVWSWDGGMNTYLGVLGAYLARSGMTAGDTALEGPQGYIEMFTAGRAPESAYDRAVEGLGTRWHTEEIAVKTRCASFMMHCAINACQEAVQSAGISLESIQDIKVWTNHWTAERLMGKQVKDYNESVFSLPFGIAAALVNGDAMTLPRKQLSALNDPLVRELMGRVRAEVDPDIDRVFGAKMPARVEVITRDGSTSRAFEETPIGKSPERPLPEEQLWKKWEENGSLSMETKDLAVIRSHIMRLHDADAKAGPLADKLSGSAS